ncbi:MAG TPA: hypothetical protein VHR66_10690 [Gemmataceae bacterium]|nr:hypothetical protein [Gemmataceae bacterium]
MNWNDPLLGLCLLCIALCFYALYKGRRSRTGKELRQSCEMFAGGLALTLMNTCWLIYPFIRDEISIWVNFGFQIMMLLLLTHGGNVLGRQLEKRFDQPRSGEEASYGELDK